MEITGTAATHASGGSTTQTQYRDASGRLTGSASTHAANQGSSRTTYRDGSGRLTGSPTSHVRNNTGITARIPQSMF